MKRFPLQTLIRLREHRVDAARMVVLERQREVQAAQDACTKIQDEITGLEDQRRVHRTRLLDAPPAGVPWPVAMEQRESHIEWLGLQAAAARLRLAKAQDVLKEAEAALDKARQEFFRAKARLDALEKRRVAWRGEQFAIEVRQEEDAAADLLQARRPVTAAAS